MGRPLWYGGKWNKIKGNVRDLYDDKTMDNRGVQEKLIELVEEEADRRGVDL